MLLNRKLFIRNIFHLWLVSSLNSKKQYVKIKNLNSSQYDVSSGVPQWYYLYSTIIIQHIYKLH